jgi:hypothetical protein
MTKNSLKINCQLYVNIPLLTKQRGELQTRVSLNIIILVEGRPKPAESGDTGYSGLSGMEIGWEGSRLRTDEFSSLACAKEKQDGGNAVLNRNKQGTGDRNRHSFYTRTDT